VTAASAPGKLFLSGEYAVLEGAPAVVTAVGRRALASITTTPPPRSPVLDAVRVAVRRFLERRDLPAAELPHVRADSSALAHARHKLGLGSSAAVAAAACGTLFEWAGLRIDEHREQVLSIARSAHAEAQGGAGSGADVAASVLGGTLVYTMDGTPESIPLAAVEPVFVWTGRSSSTTALLGAVRELDTADPVAYREPIDRLIDLARELAAAYRDGDAPAIVALTERYREALQLLGSAARVEIVNEDHRQIARLAGDCGGAAKPSGAGGGDVAVAVFADRSAAELFRERCGGHGLVLLDVALGAVGLTAANDPGRGTPDGPA